MAAHYSVFLSYRHKPLDAAVTRRAFNTLEAYKLPKALKDRGCASVERVFRDTEELPVSRVLSNTIQNALAHSDYLVVVCSPDTPVSEWVDREVATFIELGKAERIYPLLIAGEPETAFPASLKKVPDIASRVMDLRGSEKPLSPRAPGALLRVVAAVAGCPYEQLKRAERMRRSRKSAGMAVACVAVAAAVTAVVTALWLKAEAYRATALEEQRVSMEVLSHLTYGLPNKLVELPSTYAAVSEILSKNAQQIHRILGLAKQSDGIREQIAANYEKYATASTRMGDFDAAAESQQEAIAVYAELNAESGGAHTALLASAYNNLGVVRNAAGAYRDAAGAYAEAVALLRPIADASPTPPSDMAVFLSNSGANSMDFGDYEAASDAFLESIELLRKLNQDGSGQYDTLLARALYNLGMCRMAVTDERAAEEYLGDAMAIYRRQYEAMPNRTNLKNYAQTAAQVATCLSVQARLEEADDLFPTAIALLEELATGGDDAAAKALLATACNNYGLCLNMGGNYEAAAPWYLRVVDIQEELYSQNGTALSGANLARACYNVAENAFKAGDYKTMRAYYDRCLKEYAPISASLGDFHQAEYLAWLAYYDIIATQQFGKALEAAREAVSLQPESEFQQYVYIYALLYNGLYDECDAAATALDARSSGARVNIALDFDALTKAGLHEPHMDAVLALLD